VAGEVRAREAAEAATNSDVLIMPEA
jgi:hypothetical protein